MYLFILRQFLYDSTVVLSLCVRKRIIASIGKKPLRLNTDIRPTGIEKFDI